MSARLLPQEEGWIWLDGTWVPSKEARIPLLSHTLHYGVGIFEGVRAYPTARGAALFRLKDHTDRFFRSAHILNMLLPFDKTVLNRVQCEAVLRNHLTHAYIRPIAFYGDEERGLHAKRLQVHVAVAAWEWAAYLGEANLEKGIRVRTSSYVRHPVSVKAKATGNYLSAVLALQEAIQCGYDEALLLDKEGYVAEGSGENIFLVKENMLWTPPVTSCLEGITRETVMCLAYEEGFTVKEAAITRDEVYIAEECFLTGTAAEITPVREVDGRCIGTGKRGPVTEKLQKKYFDCVYGRSEAHPHWLTVPLSVQGETYA